MTAADSHSSSVDLEAEVQRLRKRTHEIQEAADKRVAVLSKAVEYWRSSLAQADSYLEESGVVFHSSVTRAKAASLFQRIASLEAQLAEISKHDVCTDRLITTLRERDEARAQLAAQTAVVEAARKLESWTAELSDALDALARLDAADVPTASNGPT